MTEQERLYWMRANQKKLRAEEYSSLQASLAEGLDPAQIGKRVILLSSHTGSPRQMIQLYQDAMAIVRVFGAPDIFITMTCNPAWSEIVNALLPGQTASDRPDIVTRVFHGKLKALLADVLGVGRAPGVFGKVIAYVYVVKFQKRGLPHAHVLLIMDPEDKPKTNDDYNKIVTAEIPDRDKFPALFVLRGVIFGCWNAEVRGCSDREGYWRNGDVASCDVGPGEEKRASWLVTTIGLFSTED